MLNNTVESEAIRVASMLNRDIDYSITVLEGVCDLMEKEAPCIGSLAPRVSTRTIAWAGLVVALFLPPLIPLDEIIGTATAFRGPPIGFHEIELLNPEVHIGQPLIVKTRGEYLRACLWHWVLEWRTDAGRPIAMEWHAGSAHVIGEVSEHEMAFELPRGIKPGKYIFHESASGECGHGDIGKIIDRDVTFTVID